MSLKERPSHTTMPGAYSNTIQIKNLDKLLELKIGDSVRVKEGPERTAVVLDWETVDNWWDGVITAIHLSEADIHECGKGCGYLRTIPKGTPTFRIAPRGKKIKLSYLKTPGYLADVKAGRSLSYWNKEKQHVFRWGVWVYPQDGDRIVKK